MIHNLEFFFFHNLEFIIDVHFLNKGFPGSSDDESTFNAEDVSLIPGSGRSSGEGNGNLLQCSCLEFFHGQRNLVGYSPWGRKELDMTEQLTLSLSVS